jgi:hypothetical protein
VGAIQIRKVMERRGQNMGPMGFAPKKRKKKQKTRGVSHCGLTIYIKWRKVVFALFCFVVMRSTERDASERVLGVFGKLLSTTRGTWEPGGVRELGSMMFGFWAQMFLILGLIFSLKIKLNHTWKFQRNWNVPLVFLERSWWSRINEIYLVTFGFKMWEILIFQVVSVTDNSNKFQKIRFWKEKSVEDVVTLGPRAH